MKVILAAALLPLLFACGGGGGPATPGPSKDPISVRGWIADAEQPAIPTLRTVETEAARKAQLFANSALWVDGASYVSGGLAENGSFLLLDVPPGKVTISFQAPGGPEVKLPLESVPGNADVFVGGIVLMRNGTVRFTDPKALAVRIPAKVDQPAPSGRYATVAGIRVPVLNTPISTMINRRDFPTPAGETPVAPVAKVR